MMMIILCWWWWWCYCCICGNMSICNVSWQPQNARFSVKSYYWRGVETPVQCLSYWCWTISVQYSCFFSANSTNFCGWLQQVEDTNSSRIAIRLAQAGFLLDYLLVAIVSTCSRVYSTWTYWLLPLAPSMYQTLLHIYLLWMGMLIMTSLIWSKLCATWQIRHT